MNPSFVLFDHYEAIHFDAIRLRWLGLNAALPDVALRTIYMH
jgi:hypothetical protein